MNEKVSYNFFLLSLPQIKFQTYKHTATFFDQDNKKQSYSLMFKFTGYKIATVKLLASQCICRNKQAHSTTLYSLPILW